MFVRVLCNNKEHTLKLYIIEASYPAKYQKFIIITRNKNKYSEPKIVFKILLKIIQR